ncbi:hypothetical protein ACQFX6_03810 [Streptomyces sp. DSM 41987]|uniref:hypothetical protein n=1 Tax=Streptomyces TaxID=1883 RepID=UPI0018E0373A|nr:hypothetical protein [Streptomyces fildesensis]
MPAEREATAAQTGTIDRLRSFPDTGGHTVAGHHHEIYLSNPNRTAPDAMRTIIRYPVKPAS